MLNIAFKEWAVVCRALAEGRQALILRKGGIAETGGQFSPEHSRFWLYPTFAHEKPEGIKPEAGDDVSCRGSRPSAGRNDSPHAFRGSAWRLLCKATISAHCCSTTSISGPKRPCGSDSNTAGRGCTFCQFGFFAPERDRVSGNSRVRRLPHLGPIGKGNPDGERHAGSR